MNNWKEYQEKNKERFLEELLALLRIPSVSARSENKKDMQQCAEAVQQRLLEAGADHAKLHPTDGHPNVFAEKIIDTNKPTVLVYGHYDVQPADPLHLWKTPAFEPTIVGDRIYGRGAADNKGPLITNIAAVAELLEDALLDARS